MSMLRLGQVHVRTSTPALYVGRSVHSIISIPIRLSSSFFDYGVRLDGYYKAITQQASKRPDFLSLYSAGSHIGNYDHTQLGRTDLYDLPERLPVDNLSSAIRNNKGKPSIGSIVEFTTGGDIQFGVVLRPSTAMFNVNYNKLIVLNTSNELMLILSTFVNFHAKEVFDPHLVALLKILENKFNDEFKERKVLCAMLRKFVSKAVEFNGMLSSQFNLVFSQYALEDRINSISTILAIESMKLPSQILDEITLSYTLQSALFLAVHMEFSHLLKFLSTSNLNLFRESNLIKGFSNDLPQGSDYFVNSFVNATACEKLHTAVQQPHQLERMNLFFEDLLKKQTSVDAKDIIELSYYFNIWDGRQFKYVVEAMKYAVVYPNSVLMADLAKLSVFATEDSKSYTLSSLEVFSFLSKLQVLENNTDALLSLSIMGSTRLNKLAISDPTSLVTPIDDLSMPNTIDFFPHLRRRKRYYSDHVLYALTIQGKTRCAVSIEKVNTRKYKFNVHVFDVATKLNPAGDVFRALARLGLVNVPGVIDQFYGKNGFGSQFEFKETVDTSESSDGPGLKTNKDFSFLTVSFTYNAFDQDPFASLGKKVEVSFDLLGPASVKCLNQAELEDSLQEKTMFSPFKLFGTHNPEEREKLTSSDRHNLGLISSILQGAFKARNRDGASICMKYPCGQTSPHMRAQKFTTKLNTFTGQLVSEFCKANEIPVLSHSQELINSENADAVLISHDNIMLPSYRAHTYAESTLVRDAQGMVSLPARLIGHNYLCPKELTAGTYSPNVPLGIPTGHVEITTGDMCGLINQLQLLNHAQWKFNHGYLESTDADHLQLVHKFAYLKRMGYNLNGPLSSEVIAEQARKIFGLEQLGDWISRLYRRMNRLRALQESTEYEGPWECVITHNSRNFLGKREDILLGYCLELELEVQVASTETLEIGQTISCDKILVLDAVRGIIVLGSEDLL